MNGRIAKPRLKSKESSIRAFVKFVNTSLRDVDVYWLNFQGDRISYSSLPPGSSCSINTYVTHPWIFSCSKTGERLKVDRKDVFMPQPWFKFIQTEQNGVVSVGRQETHIHYPVKSLKQICIWDILFLMNRNSDIRDLEIPKSLRLEMKKVYEHSTRSTVERDNNNLELGDEDEILHDDDENE